MSPLPKGMIFVCSAILVLLICVGSDGESQEQEASLVRLAIVFRHGDRTPDDPYPNDPYADARNWPDGVGQLTTKGKKRMLDVGRFIRTRYQDFLSPDPLEVHARSSSVARCLSSAALVLAGAYPPSGRYVVDPTLPHWQPIPIHAEREELDAMLVSFNKLDCPASLGAENLQQDAPDVIHYQQQNQEFMRQVSLHTGSNVSRLRDISTIYDNLKIDQEEGKRLPRWATDEVMEHLEAMDQKIYCVNSSTPAIQRLHAGPFYHDLKKVFLYEDAEGEDDEEANSSETKKAFFYSTHDTRLTSMMRAVNSYEGGGFPYGSTLIFELLQTRLNERVVRVFFLRNPLTHQLRRLKPRLCETVGDCPVADFFEGLKNYTADPQTHETECHTFPNESQITGCFP